MVVGVAHGPAALVALRLLLIAAVDEAHVAVGPLSEVVEVDWLLAREEARITKLKLYALDFEFQVIVKSKNVAKHWTTLSQNAAPPVCILDKWVGTNEYRMPIF